jgi:YbbR domain-containing protein
MAWARGLATQNLGWKLLSLAIAVALWAAVWSEPELLTFPAATVEYRNQPEDMEFTADPVSSVKLELRGPSGELSGIGIGNGNVRPQVIFDLANMGPGHHTLPVSARNVKLPRGVRLEGAIPSEIEVEFDRRLIRSVPIDVRISGEHQNGYSVVSKEVDPPDAMIVGPAGRVNAVKTALTDPIDVSSAVGFLKFRVNAYVQDPFVRFQSSPSVNVTITMRR